MGGYKVSYEQLEGYLRTMERLADEKEKRARDNPHDGNLRVNYAEAHGVREACRELRLALELPENLGVE